MGNLQYINRVTCELSMGFFSVYETFRYIQIYIHLFVKVLVHASYSKIRKPLCQVNGMTTPQNHDTAKTVEIQTTKGQNPRVSFLKVSQVFHGSDLKVLGFQTERILAVTKYQYFSYRNCQKVDQMKKLSAYRVCFFTYQNLGSQIWEFLHNFTE